MAGKDFLNPTTLMIHLLMHAMGASAGGQIGSVMAAAVMLSVLKGMGII